MSALNRLAAGWGSSYIANPKYTISVYRAAIQPCHGLCLPERLRIQKPPKVSVAPADLHRQTLITGGKTMTNYRRMFEIYRSLAQSFEAFLRIVIYRRQITGFQRLERKIADLWDAENID